MRPYTCSRHHSLTIASEQHYLPTLVPQAAAVLVICAGFCLRSLFIDQMRSFRILPLRLFRPSRFLPVTAPFEISKTHLLPNVTSVRQESLQITQSPAI